MFIAWRPCLAPKLCRSVIASCLPLQKFRCQVSLLTERDLRRALVTINISLLWSKNEFNCCACKLNSPLQNGVAELIPFCSLITDNCPLRLVFNQRPHVITIELFSSRQELKLHDEYQSLHFAAETFD